MHSPVSLSNVEALLPKLYFSALSDPAAGSRDCGAVPYKLQSICNDPNLGSGPEAKQRVAQSERNEQGKVNNCNQH